MKRDWVYMGVFFDDSERNRILEKYKSHIPQGWKTYADHMTICFNKHDDNSQHFYDMFNGGIDGISAIGWEEWLKVIAIGISDDAIALRVRTTLKIDNKIPHITLAVPQGGKPVNSNYIKHWVILDNPMWVCGTIKNYTR